ncbi:hypothetical protein AMS68_006290 [Peltaster fructicola]|uniref:RRM domain-containing protein n=1 Tax=Peltaster fructicola TaxID=286661 RepID=A0A6H0Y191_9PEZI|nr:hypothetical protein AMS68_006290 [Peltaster fructicola]
MPPAGNTHNSTQQILCIHGLPSHYTWQDVKDLARNRAEHGLRAQSSEVQGPNGERIVVWFVAVSRRAEAVSLFEWLTQTRIEGTYLIVHLFDSGSCFMANCHLSDIQCTFCRPSQAVRGMLAGRLPVQPPPMTQMPMGYAPAPAMPGSYNTATPLMPNRFAVSSPPTQTQDVAQALAARLRSHAAAGQPLSVDQESFLERMDSLSLRDTGSASVARPVYAAAPSGAIINTSNGYARTEARGVFAKGLDYKTRSKEVEALFARAGEITRCEVHVNSQGKPKGTATIQYATAAEARHAVQVLDQFKWKGRTLHVRSDRETIVIEAPTVAGGSRDGARDLSTSTDTTSQEPTIVDGSNSRQARRDSKTSSKK